MRKFLAAFSASFFILTLFLGNACTKEKETGSQTAGATENKTPACTYSADPKDIKLEWTAYKFTTKKAVKGTFTGTHVTGPTSAKTLADLAMGLKMDIDGATFESGDPGRNVTVRDFFFKLFNPPFKMSAKVTQFNGNDSQGNMMIDITMNGVTKTIPFAYTATPDGVLTAKSGIDVMDFKLNSAFASLHDACEEMHTGEDGVSKTWPDVDISLVGKFKKECTE